MITLNRTMLFDGSYMLHRSLTQEELWNMKNHKGERTGGVFGCLKTIQKELRTYNYYPIVVFDGGLSKRRLSIYPNYKRAEEKALLLECKEEDKTEEQLIEEEFRREYHTQRNILINLLPNFGIPVIYSQEWEGDDLLYILSKLSKDSIVVSDDKDLIQLLYNTDERRCRIRRPLRDEFLDNKYLQDKEINIQEFIGCKCIVGDPSDNIPSACFQVGDKTALGLYKIYESTLPNNFPKSEEELSKICKELDISKRKAYLNFNEQQFLINLSLTDLSLVDKEINDELLKNITDSIFHQQTLINKQNIRDILSYLEIKTFETEALLYKIDNLKILLDIKNIEACKDIKETTIQKQGLFKTTSV